MVGFWVTVVGEVTSGGRRGEQRQAYDCEGHCNRRRARLTGPDQDPACFISGHPLEPDTWRLVEVSQAMSATDYLCALHTLYRTGRQFNRAMQRYDVVLTPTVPMPP